MTLPEDPLQWRVGLVGYGEVGRILAEDLRGRGIASVSAYDSKLSTSEAAPLEAHAKDHSVGLAPSHTELSAHADLIISAVTANQTVAVADACAPAIRPGTWFLDVNSASPGAKQRAAQSIDTASGRYVEGAVMTAVPPYRIRVPLLVGGPHASTFATIVSVLGFNATAVADRVGVASATKMCRSVMIKGLEAMVIESLTAARAYGVEDEVLASLAETFPAIDWQKQVTYFFQRVIQHGRRRAEEMREAAETVRDVGLEPWSATGTAAGQAWMADLTAAGVFGHPLVPRPDWRAEADRILQALAGSDARTRPIPDKPRTA